MEVVLIYRLFDDLSLRCQNYNLVGAVALGWIVYGSDGHVSKSSSLVRLRFRRPVNTYPVLLQCKCIVCPSCVHSMTAHFPVLNPSYKVVSSCGVVVSGPLDSRILSRDTVVIDNYFIRSLEEWYEKVFVRGSCDFTCFRRYSMFFEINQDVEYIGPEDLLLRISS